MEENKRKRPGERVPNERPRRPGPRDARPRTGNAASRRAERLEFEALLDELQPRQRSDAGGSASERSREPERRRAAAKRPEAARSAAPKQNSAPPPKQQHSAPPAKKKAKQPPAEAEEQPVSKRKKRKPHRVYNTNFGFKFVTMLAVVAVLVLSMIIFFKVKHIEVVLPRDEDGQTDAYYTADEVRDASGIHIDDNLLSLNKAIIASRIYEELPYVNEIQVKKQLPGTVIITISEFEVTYGIQDERGGWWLMSREGRILEPADERSVKTHLIVTGMPIQVPQVGDYFKPAATDGADMSEIASKQTVVLTVIPALEPTGFVKELASVDVSTSYDLNLWYGTRYQIRLGTTEDLDYKLRTLEAILENSDVQHRSGVIDLTFSEDDKAHFLEFR